MSVVNAIPLLLADEGYQISRSVRLRSSASAYFNRTPGSATNRKTWTWSGWVKRGTLGSSVGMFGAYSTSSNYANLYFDSSNCLNFQDRTAPTNNSLLTTTQVFRDPSAWYHIVMALDTTQATSSNRIKLYVNGIQITAFSTATYYTQNADGYVNNNITHEIGSLTGGLFFDGYLTETNFVDGQALTPSSFGETDAITGVWKPKKYTGTYGTNGFFLNFSDPSAATAAAIGKDYSGNGNNWTPNNISVTSGSTYDSMLDAPTLWADGGNGRGNYATFDATSRARIAPVDGNLRWSGSSSSPGSAPFGLGRGVNFPMLSGKWYWEITPVAGSSQLIGIAAAASVFGVSSEEAGLDGTANSYFYLTGGGAWFGTTFTSGWGSSYTTSDVISIAYDADAGRLYFAKNNVWQASGNPSGGTNGVSIPASPQGQGWVPYVSSSTYTGNSYALNAGQRPFAYTPPTGFKALNTQNLPEPVIKKGNAWFDVKTWTADGVNPISITGVNFKPDLVWQKSRSAAYNHQVQDSVRGGLQLLVSNNTDAETTLSNSLTSFNNDGFTLGIGSNGNYSGTGGTTHVGWLWKEGATPGFDIVTYSGTGSVQTVAHSLGVAPSMMIVKSRSTAGTDWAVYHRSLGGTKVMVLNSTTAAITIAGSWNNTDPTSSVFTVGTGSGSGDTNGSGRTYVNYLFAPVAGFSAFGSYTGNGSTDGPFSFTGFRPRFIMLKRTDAVSGWGMIDTARGTYNTIASYLQADSFAAELTDNSFDILSNGFKCRLGGNLTNTNGGTYIYAAFAENPFKNALAR